MQQNYIKYRSKMTSSKKYYKNVKRNKNCEKILAEYIISKGLIYWISKQYSQANKNLRNI
jgi:hypothetical protein